MWIFLNFPMILLLLIRLVSRFRVLIEYVNHVVIFRNSKETLRKFWAQPFASPFFPNSTRTSGWTEISPPQKIVSVHNKLKKLKKKSWISQKIVKWEGSTLLNNSEHCIVWLPIPPILRTYNCEARLANPIFNSPLCRKQKN